MYLHTSMLYIDGLAQYECQCMLWALCCVHSHLMPDITDLFYIVSAGRYVCADAMFVFCKCLFHQ